MKHFLVYIGLSLFLLAYMSCGDKDNNATNGKYDPKQPVVPLSFYPDSGKIADQVILEGANFGNDPENIKVYFNKKQAAVTGSTGTRMLAIVPKMPGDTCTVSVVVGKDSVVYPQKFRYRISVNVTTIIGNGSSTYVLGNTLATTTFQPHRLCADEDGNVFVMIAYNNGTFLKVNEQENTVVQLSNDGQIGYAGSACVFKDGSNTVSFPSDDINEVFWTLNPREGWALKTRFMKVQPHPTIPPLTNPWKKSMAACEIDGNLYTLFYRGQLIKVDPKTYTAEYAFDLQHNADAYGMAFHPIHKNLLYISYSQNAGQFAHSICVVDITNPDKTVNAVKRLTGQTAGYRDGEVSISQFRDPEQICFDADGNLYVADRGNHCIRKITVDGMVETVVGIPGLPGHKDGDKTEAQFNQPVGVAITGDGTIYVSDRGNSRIKKLAIE